MPDDWLFPPVDFPPDFPLDFDGVPAPAEPEAETLALGCASAFSLDLEPHPVTTRADRLMAAVNPMALDIVFVMHR
ncbi:hypothetical protein NE236_20770 [Actinoallomurus purpureus]|uniref:hypothetical protein n=1 Tax=Actinoallomurus purpureus TaxID=478114 RepID=UPI0020932A28|nr:hypothetical protein [Actinoallomurus purpureus]MCO6007416.1 hypothetical protein [Actinoallomurus purpureus]